MSVPDPSFPSNPRGGGSSWRMVLMYARGLVVDQRMRRSLMFYCLLGAMFFAFVGDALLGDWLRVHLLRFVVWWLACASLTMLCILLAIYDILTLRLQHREEARRLRKQMLEREQREHDLN